MTAVAGPSGGGKSTIMKLLLGFYERESGQILFQGIALEHYRIKELHELIAYVPQEAFLFHDSIAGNIRLGRPDASDEEVENAARMAQAHTFITELPDGSVMRHLSGNAVQPCPEGSVNGLRLPEPCSKTRLFCCWTRLHPLWTRSRSMKSS